MTNSMKKVTRVAAVLLLAGGSLHAQYSPPDGAEDIFDLYSPRMLAEGAHVAGGEGPQADAFNPAMSALVQRTTLDVSYFGLSGFGSALAGGGWAGHIANLGVVSPTRVGVFSGSVHFATSGL